MITIFIKKEFHPIVFQSKQVILQQGNPLLYTQKSVGVADAIERRKNGRWLLAAGFRVLKQAKQLFL